MGERRIKREMEAKGREGKERRKEFWGSERKSLCCPCRIWPRGGVLEVTMGSTQVQSASYLPLCSQISFSCSDQYCRSSDPCPLSSCPPTSPPCYHWVALEGWRKEEARGFLPLSALGSIFSSSCTSFMAPDPTGQALHGFGGLFPLSPSLGEEMHPAVAKLS